MRVPAGFDEPVDEVGEAVGAPHPRAELTTVGPDLAVVHRGHDVRRYLDLTPDTGYEFDGLAFRTLPAPGELLATFTTVNDVHFGEQTCGIIEGSDIGPTFSTPLGAEPFPELMNRGAVSEMAALEPDAVIVKGDLTSTGTRAEYDAFRAVYEPAFGDRLTVVRGNHESFHQAHYADEPTQLVTLPGALLVVLDTSVDGGTAGAVTADQLAWLDDLSAGADRPVLVFGHHPLGEVGS